MYGPALVFKNDLGVGVDFGLRCRVLVQGFLMIYVSGLEFRV